MEGYEKYIMELAEAYEQAEYERQCREEEAWLHLHEDELYEDYEDDPAIPLED